MKLSWHEIDLHYKHPFKIARADTYSMSANVVTQIEHEGVVGLGESSPVDYMGETRESVIDGLKEIDAENLLGDDPFRLEAITSDLKVRFAHRGALRCGIDLALHDLVGKLVGEPLYRWFGLEREKAGRTCWTIGIDEPDVMLAKAAEAAGYPLKVKLGTEYDVEIIRDLRAQTPEPIRIDGNCGWTPDRAISNLQAMEQYDICLCEQPCHPDCEEDFARVSAATSIPVLADESVDDSVDVARLAGKVDGINIKLTKSGGLREALSMIRVARAHGMVIQIGCMGNSSVSTTAAAHITPLVDFADLDSPLLFSDDPYEGVVIEPGGQMVLPDVPGIGAVAV